MHLRLRASIAAAAVCAVAGGALAATSAPECAAGTGSQEWRDALREDAETLARRIHHRETTDPLPDSGRLRELADELEGVLCRVRRLHPDLEPIRAREEFAPGEVLLGFAPELMRAVSSFHREGFAGAEPETGNQAFDTLNREFGLRSVQPFPAAGLAVFVLDEDLNVPAAMGRYLQVPGVTGAEPNWLVGDGPDIGAAKRSGSWRVVFRDAWGDCPAGCIHSELHFLVVDGEAVSRFSAPEAESMPEFRGIAVRWRRR